MNIATYVSYEVRFLGIFKILQTESWGCITPDDFYQVKSDARKYIKPVFRWLCTFHPVYKD